jgi:hypothetical protein
MLQNSYVKTRDELTTEGPKPFQSVLTAFIRLIIAGSVVRIVNNLVVPKYERIIQNYPHLQI